MQPTECEEIPGWSQAGDLSKSDSRNIRLMAEFLPLVNIGQMYFNCRQADPRDSIPDRDAGVGIGSRVNDNSVVFCPSLLNPGNQLTLAIGLAQIYLHSQLLRQLRDS